MLMMRSAPSSSQKMGKPPPPVPPRPSKNLVAEALAKTKRSSAPIRVAPPPPPNPIRSPSVSVNNKANFERTLSLEHKTSTRTVVFQSPKIETAKKKSSVNKEVVLVDEKDTLLEDDDASKWDRILNDRNHVNTLIDEMFASVLEVSQEEDTNDGCMNNSVISVNVEESDNKTSNQQPVTVVVVEDTSSSSSSDTTLNTTVSDSGGSITSSNSSTFEKDTKKTVHFDDRMNHELLISELENIRLQEKVSRRQRKPSRDIYEQDLSKIQHSDWVEVNDGQEVRLSSCQITIEDLKNKENGETREDEENRKNLQNQSPTLDYERIKTMSSLHGLPPLPKSLSGFNLLDGQANKPPTPVRTTSMRGGQAPGHLVYPPHPKNADNNQSGTRNSTPGLDTQLAILRREMYSLRQLDLSLLSQLWSLNESIQDFRQILQDQEDRVLSPPSPSPVASSGDEGEQDEFYMSTSSMNFRTPPPPPPVRRPSSSSNASSLG